MTFNKMSAKLVVHKFDSDINFKSLHITIEDLDNGLSETRYSEWSDGKTQRIKDSEKSSRLIVKIVSGNEFGYLNLDSCAQEVDDPNIYFHNTSTNTTHRTGYNYYKQFFDMNTEKSLNTLNNSDRSNVLCGTTFNLNSEEKRAAKSNQQENVRNSTIKVLENSMTPLEYSLEKVKENNARIMENIHMLNRTLNYTKKKEILDIVCPKSMRYPCTTCGKCFVYETGLKRHYSTRHSMSEMQPRWQVVWTCIECFQVWPRHDLALIHSSQCANLENADCIREIKTSSILQCEFCEKVYTSIPRLLRHCKLHTTASNYECNACESSFLSYKAAEQHWLLCPWLKMCYSFSLPKMLLCNGCDRKFKNYEQLYNHRYKAAHFTTKTHSPKGGAKSLGILVYQCEICGQWFPAIPPLLNHRSQHHFVYENTMQCRSEDKPFGEYDNTSYESTEVYYQVSQAENNQQY